MEKYNLLVRIFHWFTGIYIIGLISFGLWMTSLPNEHSDKFVYYDWHKSFGIIFLALILLRITNRFNAKIPSLPYAIPKRDVNLASIVTFLLYLSMLLMPIFGYLMSNFGGYQVRVFDFELPIIFNKNQILSGFFNKAHRFTAFILIGLIILHLIGTLKHYIFEKINLLPRIW